MSKGLPGEGFGRSRRRSGITLIELLVVIAVAIVLTSLATASLFGSRATPEFSSNISTLSGILEYGRQQAITSNTYLWVLLAPGTDANNLPCLSVVCYERQDGIGTPASSGNVIGGAGETWVPTRKMQTLGSFLFQDQGLVSVSALPAESSLGALTTVAVPLNHAGTVTTFTRGILFSPQGDARATNTTVRFLEFGLVQARQPANKAVFRLNTLTGKLWIYRQ